MEDNHLTFLALEFLRAQLDEILFALNDDLLDSIEEGLSTIQKLNSDETKEFTATIRVTKVGDRGPYFVEELSRLKSAIDSIKKTVTRMTDIQVPLKDDQEL
jgi:hypothetical protein